MKPLMQIILTHDNADFDGIAAMLAAHKLYPHARPVLPGKLNRNVEEFLTLYRSGLPFTAWDDLRGGSVSRIILVDTQKLPAIRNLKRKTPLFIIDHHPQERTFEDHVTFSGDNVGAATTLLVEQIRSQNIPVSAMEATVMMLGIYSDTGSLTYDITHPRDVLAAAWLLEQQAGLDTVRKFLSPPLDDSQQALLDKLIGATETRVIEGFTVTVASVEMPHYVYQINSVAHRLRNLLEPDGLVVVVKMPKAIQMVCRGRSDAIDLGAVARHFGGGGHTRAAAANISAPTLEAARTAVWEQLDRHIQPAVRVADLMSFGVQAVRAHEAISDIMPRLRRIGHEGYPVLENGAVVGLLTRRDADRALEHGLTRATVREVMSGGVVTLHAHDTVSTLEQAMVESGWGQIPVVDDAGSLTGIVTRTDLIKHWGRVHPAERVQDEYITIEQIRDVLGDAATRLIQVIADRAQQQQLNMYLVGGVVRDLFLQRPNLDIDFVIEADAIAFAESLCDELGGSINSYRPFGTAKWRLDESVGAVLDLDTDLLPDTIDFATSRNEFYTHPTALPSVYSSSIKLDLHRRDFTINALAIQVSPQVYRVLDFYGGLNDLHGKLIRVLHSLSFVDDPTRILRAIRFEFRLGFQIEERTAELIAQSHEMLRRITGERVRNELRLLLREPYPERALRAMDERGLLVAIHPYLHFPPEAAERFVLARGTQNGWPVEPERLRYLYWHVWMAHIPHDRIDDLGRRLLFSQDWITALTASAQLFQEPLPTDLPVSQIVRRLQTVPEIALLAVWILSDSSHREQIRRYLDDWQYIQPTTTGRILRERGLPPGPAYKTILNRLRDARLDGEIASDDDENDLLARLVEEAQHDHD